MKIRFLITAALLSIAPLAAATEQTPPTTTAPAEEHPFFRTDLYPAWSKMTPQQALTDVRAAIAQAHERLAALAAITPENSTFENTFLAWYEAGENIKQAMNYVYHLHISLGDKEMQHMMDKLLQETTTYSAEGLHGPHIVQVYVVTLCVLPSSSSTLFEPVFIKLQGVIETLFPQAQYEISRYSRPQAS